jgi:hypothetical protein
MLELLLQECWVLYSRAVASCCCNWGLGLLVQLLMVQVGIVALQQASTYR